ncbi:MAG: Uma2 family endonuclease [Dehalococcoidia bacterium]
MTQLAERLYSAEEFERLPDAEAFELDDGVLKERCMGAESEGVAIDLIVELKLFLRAHPGGIVVPPNTGLRILANPRRVPRADGGYISAERLPAGRLPRGELTIAPDLLIESVSPGDAAEYVDRKVEEYIGAGVRLVWVLQPATRTAMVYRADGTVARIPATGALEGEDVLPGFRCELATIMPRA